MQCWSASEDWYIFDFTEVKKQWLCMGTIATIYAVIFDSITKAALKTSNTITTD